MEGLLSMGPTPSSFMLKHYEDSAYGVRILLAGNSYRGRSCHVVHRPCFLAGRYSGGRFEKKDKE